MLDVRCSTFISFFFDLTGRFLAGGWAEHWHLNPYVPYNMLFEKTS